MSSTKVTNYLLVLVALLLLTLLLRVGAIPEAAHAQATGQAVVLHVCTSRGVGDCLRSQPAMADPYGYLLVKLGK